MPTASGLECVRVLVGFGWFASSWTDRECMLEKGPIALTVPLEPELSPALVQAIAGAAGIGPYAFVEAVGRLRTSASWPKATLVASSNAGADPRR